MHKIIKNAIKCNRCGDIIMSTCRHEIRSYSCGYVYVDGGHDYPMESYDDYTDVVEFEEEIDG